MDKLLKIFFPLFLVILVDAIAVGLVLPTMTPLFFKQTYLLFPKGINQETLYLIYAIVLSAYPLAMFFGLPILGDLSDKLGRKPILIISMLGVTLGLLITAFGIQYAKINLIIAGRLFSGLTAGSFSVSMATVIDKSTTKDKASNLSIAAGANCLGFTLGPVIGGLLSDDKLCSWFDFSTPYFIVGLLPLLIILLLWFYMHDKKVHDPTRKIQFFSGLYNIYYALKKSPTKLYFFVFTLFYLAHMIYFNNLALFIQRSYHYTSTLGGLYMSFYAFWFFIALVWLIPKYHDRFNLRTAAIVSIILQGILIFILATVTVPIVSWLVLIPDGIAMSVCYVALTTLISNNTPEKFQGRVMSVVASLAAFTWMLGPILASINDWMNARLPFYTSVIIFFFVFLLSLNLKNASAIANTAD